MGGTNLASIVRSPAKRIANKQGDVLHGVKCTDVGFRGFGEAYFSFILPNAVKAWKRHRDLTMNLIVPVGMVRFVFLVASNSETFREERIGVDDYCRLTVPPGIWFGFQGVSNDPSLVLNLANLPHDPKEADTKSKDSFAFNWLG